MFNKIKIFLKQRKIRKEYNQLLKPQSGAIWRRVGDKWLEALETSKYYGQSALAYCSEGVDDTTNWGDEL